jgi:hypothetical protein
MVEYSTAILPGHMLLASERYSCRSDIVGAAAMLMPGSHFFVLVEAPSLISPDC